MDRPTFSKKFYVELIKPSHYDDDGYVIQWWKGWVPSNSLGVLYGLTLDTIAHNALGPEVEIVLNAYDETTSVVPIERIAGRLSAPGSSGLVCLVGVQTNQFPRAMDIARQLRPYGIQVAIGGFHVSGCISMLPQLRPDLQEALDNGITLFAGEAEGRLAAFFQDAYRRELQPIYNFMGDLPALPGQPTPYLPKAIADQVSNYNGAMSCFDAGRGCPFQCSFCTIINVQGRKSRHRDADDVEALVRADVARGIRSWFITDDNIARNRNWEAILDRLGDLREEFKLHFTIVIQVDTLCHKIPGFIEKAKRAGVERVFIGLENINPDNLASAKKRQNRITEYRAMLQAWHQHHILTLAGYILGFPNDTPQTIARDIEVIQRELPIDILEFFCLTPLPGSVDHQKLHMAGVEMVSDMNVYDLEHVCTGHPRMSKDEWQGIYRQAWDLYYSNDHVKTLMKRKVAAGDSPESVWVYALQFVGSIRYEKVHPLQAGIIRRKIRTQRRSGLLREQPVRFYVRRGRETLTTYVPYLWCVLRSWLICKWIKHHPATKRYSDIAITPIYEDGTEQLKTSSQFKTSAAEVLLCVDAPSVKGEAEPMLRTAAQ